MFAVNTTDDTVAVDLTTGNDANGHISLRSAIQAANNLGGDNSISLPAGAYNLMIAGANEDDSATGDLDIKSNLTIQGAGQATTIIDAKSLDRALHILAGYNVAISDLTIQGGEVRSDYGGGIFNKGTLALTRDTIANNLSAGGNVLGIGMAAVGGGIYNGGQLAISDCTISSNQAIGGAGGPGMNGSPGFKGSFGNFGGFAQGGGIFNATGSQITIVASRISTNQAIGGAGGRGGNGGVAPSAGRDGGDGGDGGTAGAGDGGGIYSDNGAALTIFDTLVASNTAQGGDGGQGGSGAAGANGADGAPLSGQPGGRGGNGGDGGWSVFRAGPGRGGGIYIDANSGDSLIRGSTISKNVAIGGQGGAGGLPGRGGNGGAGGSGFNSSTASGGPGGRGGDGGTAGSSTHASGLGSRAFGGGVFADPTAHLTVELSTFVGNSATHGAGTVLDVSAVPGGTGGIGGRGGTGGGTGTGGAGGAGGNGGTGASQQIFGSDTDRGGGISFSGILQSSTIVGNSANGLSFVLSGQGGPGGAHGLGGLGGSGPTGGTDGANGSTGSMGAITGFNSSALSSGGGIDGNPSMRNSIVTGNNAVSIPDGGSDSLGHNLIGADAKLGPLQDNGGPTQTMALLAGSPAIGAGDPALFNTPDQRGYNRGMPVDIGAFQTAIANVAPSFTNGPNLDAIDESGPTCVSAFAKDISPGPPYESAQHISFQITVDKPELFTSPPTVDQAGQICFTPTSNVRGSGIVTVTIHDDGGTANGGVDTSSSTRSFQIDKPRLWWNAINHLDVTNDTHFAANDALAVIDYINAFGSFLNGKVPPLGTILRGQSVDIAQPFGFLDDNGDGFVAANDVLDVINAINAGEGEGEQSGIRNQESVQTLNDLMALLAGDIALQPKRRY